MEPATRTIASTSNNEDGAINERLRFVEETLAQVTRVLQEMVTMNQGMNGNGRDSNQNQFIRMTKGYISEEHVVSFYLGGLPTEIEMGVRMCKPRTLADAYQLTNLQEATLEAVKKKNKAMVSSQIGRFGSGNTCYGSNSRSSLLPLPASNTSWKTKPNTPINAPGRKQVTQKEYQEKRDQNLCFYCDQKYTPRHKCSGKIFSIVLLADEELECKEEYMEKESSIPDENKKMTLRGTPKSEIQWLDGNNQNKEFEGVANAELLMFSVYPNTGKFTLVFFDDILIYSKSLKDHVQHLLGVLITMRKNKLIAKKSICVFGTSHVEYLGHVISAKGVATDPSKITAMQEWPTPSNVKQLRGFWGLPVIIGALPDFTKSFEVETDASRVGIGAVLQQSVLLALDKWRGYLLDRHFIIKTDHFSLKYLIDQRITTPTQMKWLPKLMRFDYEIVYKKGSENGAADALSRVQTPELFRQNPELRKELLQYFHGGSVKGHSRVKVTTHKICLSLYWKGLRKQVKQYVRECLVCQKCKPDLAAYPGLLQSLPVSQNIWTSISMDFIEGLPKSQGKDVIFVVVDRLKLFKLLQVQLLRSTAYHPQTDDHTEVVNRCLEGYLRCMIGEHPKEWMKWLSLDELWYNSNFHTATQSTPFETVYGVPPPIHVPYLGGLSKVEAVDRTLKSREESIQTVKFHLIRSQNRMKQQADREGLKEVLRGEIPSGQHIEILVSDQNGRLAAQPLALLDRKMVKKRNAVYGLVQWTNGSVDDATWEPLDKLSKDYPEFDSNS
nr:hypothetical protein [Tanacetum cinerariifolium]